MRARARRGPEIDARSRRIDRAVTAGLAFELSPRTALTTSIRLDEANYDEGQRFRGTPLDDALNRTGRVADAGVRYALTALTTLTVAASYEEQIFKQSHIRDLTRYTVGPTLEFSPEAAIRGRASAAFEMFKPDDPALAQQVGAAYQAGINWSLYGRTTFDLEAGRNISYSYHDTEPYYRLTNARLTVGQPLLEWFELYGGVDWNHLSYDWRRGADAQPVSTKRIDRLNSAHGGIGIRLGGGFRLRIGVEKTRRRSVEDPLQNYNRTRILSNLVVGS